MSVKIRDGSTSIGSIRVKNIIAKYIWRYINEFDELVLSMLDNTELIDMDYIALDDN